MAASKPRMECGQCGATMDEKDSWSTKSPPLIGKTVEFAEYTCPECGHGQLFKRSDPAEPWEEA